MDDRSRRMKAGVVDPEAVVEALALALLVHEFPAAAVVADDMRTVTVTIITITRIKDTTTTTTAAKMVPMDNTNPVPAITLVLLTTIINMAEVEECRSHHRYMTKVIRAGNHLRLIQENCLPYPVPQAILPYLHVLLCLKTIPTATSRPMF